MQIFFTIKKYLPLWLTLFTLAAFFVLPSKAVGQRVDTARTTVKTKKNARILYGMASFYANKFDGRKTASGEIFSQKKLTCACNVLPLGTWVKVTNLRNNHTVVVKTNDRIHPKVRRVVDLTRAAAEKLGFISGGLTRVKVEVIGPNPPH